MRGVEPLARVLVAAALALAALGLPAPAGAAGAGAPLAPGEKYRRSVERYEVPDVRLTNQEGKTVALRELLAGDRPVLLDFIYGTCTTICPVLSAGYANFQKKAPAGSVRLVSVTIDPEHDRPDVLREYLRRYGALPGWDFLTGTRQDIDRVMHAFEAYVPNKMSHYPLTLIRRPADGAWIRIYGLLGTRELQAEHQAALEGK